jgi:hypothetical protein
MTAPYNYGSSSTAGATSFNVAGVAAIMAAGDVLVVNVWSATAATGVTDTKGNSYVLVSVKGGVSQWVTAGKTVAVVSGDNITITLASSGAGNADVIGVPGAAYAPVDIIAAATGSGTSLSVATGAPVLGLGQTAIACFASAGGAPSITGSFTALGSSHGASPEFLQTAYQAGVNASVTASATATTGAWAVSVVTLQMTSFVNAAPVPPSQFAGQLATSSDMNALANTALFLRRPPMVIAQSVTTGTGQSLVAATDTPVQYSSIPRDTDGFFATANPSRLTVQTPGIYLVRYSIPFAVAGQNCQCKVRITTGSNNPAGAGVLSIFWYAFAAAANAIDGCVCGGGILPVFMYALDYIEILAQVVTTSNMPIAPQPAITSLRMVST